MLLKIKNLQQRALASWRSCGYCLNSVGLAEFLCAHCWELLSQRKVKHQPMSYPFVTRSIFTWWPQDEIVNLVIAKIKQPARPPVFDEIFENSIDVFSDSKITPQTIFVPAPAREKNAKDHAFLWCQAVARVLGKEPANFLQRASQEEQKGLGLAQRKRARVLLNSSVVDRPLNNVVFCDDIITSGSTAKAAYEALQKPDRFEVWTIAYRPRLVE